MRWLRILNSSTVKVYPEKRGDNTILGSPVQSKAAKISRDFVHQKKSAGNSALLLKGHCKNLFLSQSPRFWQMKSSLELTKVIWGENRLCSWRAEEKIARILVLSFSPLPFTYAIFLGCSTPLQNHQPGKMQYPTLQKLSHSCFQSYILHLDWIPGIEVQENSGCSYGNNKKWQL